VWTNEHITASGIISESAEGPIINRQPAAPTRADGLPESPVAILGVPFDTLTIAKALHRIGEMIASREPQYVVTANVDFCVQALEDVELHRILLDASLVLCDGTPLVWASRLLGNPLPERVAGADLAPLLIGRAAEKGYRIFLLGGAPDVAQSAVARLQEQHPRLMIAGYYSPPYRPLLDMNHDEICERIRAAKPDLLFVSFGCPKAEKWMAMHYRSLGVPVSIGVGATIDFLAGRVHRAPEWMQICGLEWVYRLSQEPRRLGPRYLADLRHIGAPLAAQFWSQRIKSPARSNANGHAAVTLAEPTWLRVRAPESVFNDTLIADSSLWRELDGHHCLLDLSSVRFMDSKALGSLIRLRRHLQPWHLILLAPSETVRGLLHRFKLADFFDIASDTIEAHDILCPQMPKAPREFAHPSLPLLWTGELTAANSEEVWAATQQQIESLHNAGHARIAIDLSGLRFIDSTGLGIMLRVQRYAQTIGVTLAFESPHPNVQNVLRLARLERLLIRS
jgi:N-acetylglucosaminyldiphosphoundecaprenol N-acetyl-beta-D-mannosaminyltransferase